MGTYKVWLLNPTTAWERLCFLLDKAKIEYKSIKATGREAIYVKDSDARVEFRTRSSKGGLGEGFDLLVIDEAQEYSRSSGYTNGAVNVAYFV